MALHAQGLGAAVPEGWAAASGTTDEARIAAVVRQIGCLQLDPVATVARSPLLVLHARLGAFDDEALGRAAYADRALFEYWCHEASLCFSGDLPVHRAWMRRYLERPSPRGQRQREFLAANARFARSIVRTLRRDGPLPAIALEDRSAEPWRHGHWTDAVDSRQTIARMLDLLWMTGKIGVADRDGAGSSRRWDVMERCLPPARPGEPVSVPSARVTRVAAVRAVAMLGVARAADVRVHFTRNRYDDLPATLERLTRRGGPLAQVAVRGEDGHLLRGPWYAHGEDLDVAPTLQPRGAGHALALSPFDNVLCDRKRAAQLFGFDHRLEIYVPPAKRRWGYYVLPVLVGERFVARADAAIDRDTGVLRVKTLHREPGVSWSRALQAAVHDALAGLAAHRGATDVHVEATL